ncbi:MAG TPA: molybdate ABC transporter substrate-binding protein [Stellaceae bacterium]|nr:molybdate ABC transporter substrate-binding protein [Stellaceae bacterium]
MDDQRVKSRAGLVKAATTRRSFALGIAVTAASGLGCLPAIPIKAAAAATAEIKVMTSVALTSALDELKPVFERATGNRLAITYALISDLRKRILEGGESADVIMLSRPVMDELAKANKVMPDTLATVASTAVSLVVRAGAARPDIGSVDAFKQTLLSAKSIVYADPAKGGASGVYFARVIERLGIAEQLKAKTILVPGAQSAEVVAKGEAELGVAQASEIVPVAGAQLLGPFPGEFASLTVFAAGIGAETKSTEGAKALIHFLTGPEAAPVLKAKGFQPG